MSSLSGLSLVNANLLVTNIIFLATVVCTYFLGKKLISDSFWSAILTVCVFTTAYSMFLSYPIFAPKMLGYMVFPISLLMFLPMIYRNQGYGIAYLGLLIHMVLYFVSFAYTVLALATATFLCGLFTASSRNAKLQHIRKQLIFWGLTAITAIIIMQILKGPNGVFQAPPIEVTELIYKNHKFTSRTFIGHVISASASLLAIAFGFYLIRKSNIKKEELTKPFRFFFILTIVLLMISILSHSAASTIAQIRTTWFWRASNFSHLSAVMCLFIGLQSVTANSTRILQLSSINGQLRKAAYVTFFILMALLARNVEFPWVGLKLGAPPYYANDGDPPEEQDRALKDIIQFTKNLAPKPVRMLLPPIHWQNVETDIFEAEAQAEVIVSRNDRMHLIYQTSVTIPYSEDIVAYRKLIERNNESDWSTLLVRFAKEKGATHILWRKKSKYAAPQVEQLLKPVLKNSRWIIFCVKEERGEPELCRD